MCENCTTSKFIRKITHHSHLNSFIIVKLRICILINDSYMELLVNFRPDTKSFQFFFYLLFISNLSLCEDAFAHRQKSMLFVFHMGNIRLVQRNLKRNTLLQTALTRAYSICYSQHVLTYEPRNCLSEYNIGKIPKYSFRNFVW